MSRWALAHIVRWGRARNEWYHQPFIPPEKVLDPVTVANKGRPTIKPVYGLIKASVSAA
jgi:hypothetical protein